MSQGLQHDPHVAGNRSRDEVIKRRGETIMRTLDAKEIDLVSGGQWQIYHGVHPFHPHDPKGPLSLPKPVTAPVILLPVTITGAGASASTFGGGST